LGIIESLEESETLASTVNDTAGICFVPALTGLGTPQWNANARGTIFGITPGSSKAHIARAALEGICFQLSDVVETMIDDTGKDIGWIIADGRASRNNLLMQMQADFLGKEVRRTALTETTALGAAKMAGLAANIWEEDLAVAQYDRSYAANISNACRLEKRRQWKRAVSLCTKWGDKS
jgi:glycerol kinase